MTKTKEQQRKRRQRHIRKSIAGTSDRPRLNVYRSNNHIYAQIVDDEKGVTIAAASDKDISKGTNIEKATAVGKSIAEKAKAKKVATVIFDRGGYKFHGRVKALAEGAREGGLKF